jgi:drug/metabolite transporter (DMT)-like permease
LIRLSWVVFLHAATLSIESIVIEALTTELHFGPLVIAANSIPIAGAILLLITFAFQQERAFAVFSAWKYLLPGSILLAAGVFMWYDSVGRVGASKEGLLAGPLETIVILLLARAVLQEKLSRLQMAGAMIALAGFFATVTSGSSSVHQAITWGDIEAILSAAAFGSGIIFISKLTKGYSALSVTASSLSISGLILAVTLWLNSTPKVTSSEWVVLLLFSMLPLSAALSYVMGLVRIGASLTSTIGSFSILLTVAFQLALVSLGLKMLLPPNIPLAIAGGILGVFGIYLIHTVDRC